MSPAGGPTPLPGTTQIAGKKTVDAWNKLSIQLETNPTQNLWEKTFDKFFGARLDHRYFKPIAALERKKLYKGEGFSIVAIQCSLIEFLESTIQGKTYRYRRRNDPPLTAHEYGESRAMFKTFLKDRAPFSKDFDEPWAEAFYTGVRCGLLHEAGTRGGWRIRVDGTGPDIFDKNTKIIYRKRLQGAFRTFLKSYRSDLLKDPTLQEAFIRKMNSLCHE